MINIRANVFETNSSSVHSLILCNANDYRAWIDGDKLFNIWEDDDPQFVTPAEATQYDEYYPYPKMTEDTWGYSTDFMDDNGEYHDRKFLTFEEYQKTYGWDFETFDDTYITPGGEEVVGFGYFGHD